MSSPVQQNLDRVRCNIAEACARFDRNPDEVNLLAVTKTVEPARIEEAQRAGQYDFGENYLQEALPKVESTALRDASWHFIGAIQSNKTADIARHFDWVHTVSSLKVATRLSRQRPGNLPSLRVMVQVNITGEPTKAGVSPAEASALVEGMVDLDRLEIRGLMAIPSPSPDFEEQRQAFRALRLLRDDIAARLGVRLADFSDLSMGMSGDMVAAIAEGATWLRIGTAIFGPRNTSK